MNFNTHSHLEGKHAFLSASQYHWLRYDEEKMQRKFENFLAAARGSQLHDLAARLIKLGVKLPRTSATLNAYVNDAIGFRMTPEQVLYYSENVFGTTDAISFRKNFLRIHDLKNGVHPGSHDQTMIYAALFCLEYDISPATIDIELRIYQSDDVSVYIPDPKEIIDIMDLIKKWDARIVEFKREAF